MIKFPKVRRIFPGMIASDIVSVQPMTMPSTIFTYKTVEQRVEDLEMILAKLEALPIIKLYKDKE